MELDSNDGRWQMDEREERYYISLYEAAAAVNSALTPEDVLRSIVQNVAETLDAKGCALMLLTPDKSLLLHTAAHGLSDRYVRKGPVSADRSIAEALEGRPVAVLSAPEDERLQYRKQAKEEGIASILSVPVLLRGEVIGVMRVYTAESRHFTEADIYFVGAVANLGAIALENARLYDTAKKDYEALRLDLAEWRAALGYEWMAEESVLPARE
jgi:GAF domain-containing protein